MIGTKSVSGRQRGMQGEFLAVALRDHAGAVGVGKLVVAAFAGHDAFVQVSDQKITCTRSRMPPLPSSLMPSLLADGGGAAVAAGEVVATQRFDCAIDGAGLDRHAGGVLREVDQFADRSAR